MKAVRLAVVILLSAGVSSLPSLGQNSYAAGWQELLNRAADGHSPTAEEIAAAGSPATEPDAAAVQQAVPSIRKALTYPDAQVRTYALTALIGLQVPPPAATGSAPLPAGGPADSSTAQVPPAADAGGHPAEPLDTAGTPASATPDAKAPSDPPPVPTAYTQGVAAALAPVVPELGRELTDEASPNRILAATAFAGFASKPPTTAYPPLLAYLRRDDGVGPVGDAVVDDILLLGPVADSTAATLVQYLRRTDQTAEMRASLIESIGGHAHQSPSVNAALLTYLNSDDPSVRARLILTLPQLDLSPDLFADTRSRVAVLAADDQENPQVVRAAKAVSACWTAPRVPGCPVN